MKLYLIQHGESVSGEVDPDRPLTDKGRKDIEILAELLRENGTEISKILHSGKTRAQQTAEILATTLLQNGKIETINGIAPKDSIEKFTTRIPELDTNSVVVSHLPFLAKLVSSLITGNYNQTVVEFQPGTIVCIEQDADAAWKIQWMIRPDCF